MKKFILLFLMITAASAITAAAKVHVVASSSDLASIAREVGGWEIDVTAIGEGKTNLHFVEMLPSYMLKVSRADLYLKVGLAMDQWAAGIIDGSRNDKLVVVDCSVGIDVIDKPNGKVDASMGDIHPEGNPHYWLDPRNGKVIAKNILDGLTRVDPGHKGEFDDHYQRFCTRLDSAWLGWSAASKGFAGLKVISYHSSWAYLAKAFGFSVAGFIEPKPGIEPTASHTAELIDVMKAQQVKLILREPYFSDRAPNALAKETGATVALVPSSVGGVAAANDYLSLFDTLIEALRQGGAQK